METTERTPLKETSPADTGGGSTAGASSFQMELSWLKLYISDIGLDLADLSMEERGIYCWVMLQQWKRGPMPQETVRFYAGKPFAEMSPTLQTMFVELSPGMFGLAWLEVRRSVQIQRHKTNKANALKGGRPKKKNRTVSEKEPNAKRPPSTSSSSIPIPKGLEEEWEEFRAHRRELKKPMTERSEVALLAEVAALGIERAKAAIKHSIANGWQGIFEAKTNGQPAKVDTAERKDLKTTW